MVKNKILVLYNSNSSQKIQEKDYYEKNSVYYSYSLNAGSLEGKEVIHCNKPNLLNRIALEERDDFSDFIYSLNDLYLNVDLVTDNLSLYFISDISSKRTEHSSIFITICHLLQIKWILKKHDFKQVFLDGLDSDQVYVFQSNFKKIDFQVFDSKKKASKNYYLRQGKFFIEALIKIFLTFVIFSKTKKKLEVENLYLSRYPIEFNQQNNEIKYGKLVSPADGFLISIITDSQQQNIPIHQYTKRLKELAVLSKGKRIILLDSYISFSCFFRALRLSFSNKNKLNKIKSIPSYKGLDLSNLILDEMRISLLKTSRLFLYKKAIIRAFNTLEIKKSFVYYLHEYSYGRFFTYMIGKYFPKIDKVGFQHGPASIRKLLYYLSNKEVPLTTSCIDYRTEVPIPDAVLAEDKASKKIYEYNGYKNVSVMPEIYRLEYLKSIKREKIQKNSVLIAAGLHDGEAILSFMLNEIKNNPEKEYLFKYHPKSDIQYLSKYQVENVNNLSVASRPISDYLAFVEEVVITYSSIGYEAKSLGIQVRVLSLANKINESPLYNE